MFDVDINDKIYQTLIELVELSFNTGGTLLFEGQVVIEDDSFVGKNVHMNAKFLLLLGGGGSRKVPIPWRRSKNVQNESYTGGSAEYSDALKFEAKVDVVVYGFMWNKEYNLKDFTLKFQFRVGQDSPSDWYETSRTPADIQTEDQYHFIDFQDFGIKGVKVSAGEFFDI